MRGRRLIPSTLVLVLFTLQHCHTKEESTLTSQSTSTPNFGKISVTPWIRIITHPAGRNKTENGNDASSATSWTPSNNNSDISNISDSYPHRTFPALTKNDLSTKRAFVEEKENEQASYSNTTSPMAAQTQTGHTFPETSEIRDGFVTTLSPRPLSTPPTSNPAGDIREFLNMLNNIMPDIRHVISSGQQLTTEQRQKVLKLAESFGDTLSTVAKSFTGENTTADLVKLLDDSDLLPQLTDLAGPSIIVPGERVTIDTTGPYTLQWLKCQADILSVANGIGSGNRWAIQMLDSWGKPEFGILRGNLMFLGNNKECRSVHYTNSTTFEDVRGNMCRMNIKVDALQDLAALAAAPPAIKMDLCLPRSCQSEDLNKLLKQRGLSNIDMTCTADLDIGDDPWAIVAIMVLVVLLILMVVGTCSEFCLTRDHKAAVPTNTENCNVSHNGVAAQNGKPGVLNGGFEMKETSTDMNGEFYTQQSVEIPKKDAIINGFVHDYTVTETNGHVKTVHLEAQSKTTTHQHHDENKDIPSWQRLLLAFSLPRNTSKILSVQAGPASIACLHGIRVLSLGWVIFGHVFGFTASMSIYKNGIDMFDLVNTFTFQVMVNGTLSVDTFFVLSGLLTSYLFLKQCGKKGKITVKQGIMYYVHRYWRLTPAMLVMAMVIACLLQYIGEGRPAWTDHFGASFCRKGWWVNLLYIQNLETEHSGCLGVTWYLANDMQFYILAPIVLIPWVYKKHILGFCLAGIFILTHLISSAWLVYDYNFDLLRPQLVYMDKLYVKPWARCAPFFIGVIVGYILYKTKCKIQFNKMQVAIGWLVAMGAMLTITLVTYDENKDRETAVNGWPALGKMVHETLSRPVWAAVVAWIIVACASGNGGFINSILSWEGWLPLSRLSYCAYLVHVTVINYEMAVPGATYLYTMTDLIYRFFGFYVMSYAVAYLLAVSVEAPMLALEKLVLAK